MEEEHLQSPASCTLTLGSVLEAAAIDPLRTLAIRHTFVRIHEDGGAGINANSTDEQILEYTGRQSTHPRIFPSTPSPLWLVFLRDSGSTARLWSAVDNVGVAHVADSQRHFDLERSPVLADLRNRLIIGWKSPRTWWVTGSTAASYPVVEIADPRPIPFPGFDQLILSYAELQAVMQESRYASWRTALSSVLGIYLITDMRDGRQYVGKADGAESIRQRWDLYARTGHGGNIELRGRTPSTFQFSLLRVFDPTTPMAEVDRAESHFKEALGTRTHGLNRN